jgi:hypothetical protein
MKTGYKRIHDWVAMNLDDLEILLFVGLPFGILLILLSGCFDFTNLD